eukprot:2825880-Prymnesium_polylepis.1
MAGSFGGAIFADGLLIDVSFHNGSSIMNSTAFEGGAMFLKGSVRASVTDRSSIVESQAIRAGGGDCFSKGGAVILLHDAVLILADHSRVVNSVSCAEGAAVYIQLGSLTVVNGSRIVNSSLSVLDSKGAAIYVLQGQATVEHNSSISGSQAGFGGAVYLAGGQFNLYHDSLIEDSTARWGAAIYTLETHSAIRVVLFNVTIVNSTSLYGGGAIAINSGVVTVSHSSIARSQILESFLDLQQETRAIHSYWLNQQRLGVNDRAAELRYFELYEFWGILVASGHDRMSAACFDLMRGELHLVNAVIDGCSASGTAPPGQHGHAEILSIGNDPLLRATLTEFRQRKCTNPMFRQLGSARMLLRGISFTPLDECDAAELALPSAFPGVTSEGCDFVMPDRTDLG